MEAGKGHPNEYPSELLEIAKKYGRILDKDRFHVLENCPDEILHKADCVLEGNTGAFLKSDWSLSELGEEVLGEENVNFYYYLKHWVTDYSVFLERACTKQDDQLSVTVSSIEPHDIPQVIFDRFLTLIDYQG